METARDHFDWCVKRAKQYIDMGDAQQAFASFVSDMNKHEETVNRIPPELQFIGMMEILNGPDAIWKWIQGFPRP